jgi:hypothetical protein
VAAVRPLLQAHWQRLTDELVPMLERLIEQDAARGAPAPHRVRFGLYGFDNVARDAAAPPAPPARRKPSRKNKP